MTTGVVTAAIAPVLCVGYGSVLQPLAPTNVILGVSSMKCGSRLTELTIVSSKRAILHPFSQVRRADAVR
ncbi:hypothetical protein MIR68_011642 [Amoeboaphelidium protococcarum]|nr:hypothetical protein MIR68_011642 [Amoeboaphelidium protococcarum]